MTNSQLALAYGRREIHSRNMAGYFLALESGLTGEYDADRGLLKAVLIGDTATIANFFVRQPFETLPEKIHEAVSVATPITVAHAALLWALACDQAQSFDTLFEKTKISVNIRLAGTSDPEAAMSLIHMAVMIPAPACLKVLIDRHADIDDPGLLTPPPFQKDFPEKYHDIISLIEQERQRRRYAGMIRHIDQANLIFPRVRRNPAGLA